MSRRRKTIKKAKEYTSLMLLKRIAFVYDLDIIITAAENEISLLPPLLLIRYDNNIHQKNIHLAIYVSIS
ncbi:MAG: hypothetical protein JO297_00155 [Nitrososphaeraceae archaeon]|nr:hypothetical protein [Nitrososphaeraceae archaeon]